MLSIPNIFYEYFQYIKNAETHHSMAHLPLIGSPWPTLTIVGVYLLFILKWGPAHMETRKPYNLKQVLLAYNFAQIVMCLVFNYYSTLVYFFGHKYDYGCITSSPDNHPYRHIEIGCYYAYFIFKIIDLMDTVFFVLRKSYRQVTVLHVYHHIMVVAYSYGYLNYYGARGQLIGTVFINGIVHTIMYTYYFASAYAPKTKDSIRIKKSITIMQLIQFVLMFAHQVYPILFRPSCEYPAFLLGFSMLQAVVLIILFGNFYRKAYLQPKRKVESNGNALEGDYFNNGVHKCILSTGVQMRNVGNGAEKQILKTD